MIYACPYGRDKGRMMHDHDQSDVQHSEIWDPCKHVLNYSICKL